MIQVDYDETEVVDVELRAGQMCLHHVRVVHGSHCNRSRIGFSIRYRSPDVESMRTDQSAVLVRGVDRFGNWQLHSRPPDYSTLELAVRAHQEEADRFLAALPRD